MSTIRAPIGDSGGGTRVRPAYNFTPQTDHDAPHTANTAAVQQCQAPKDSVLRRVDRGLKEEHYVAQGTNPVGEQRTALAAGFIYGHERCCETSAFRRRVANQRGESLRWRLVVSISSSKMCVCVCRERHLPYAGGVSMKHANKCPAPHRGVQLNHGALTIGPKLRLTGSVKREVADPPASTKRTPKRRPQSAVINRRKKKIVSQIPASINKFKRAVITRNAPDLAAQHTPEPTDQEQAANAAAIARIMAAPVADLMRTLPPEMRESRYEQLLRAADEEMHTRFSVRLAREQSNVGGYLPFREIVSTT